MGGPEQPGGGDRQEGFVESGLLDITEISMEDLREGSPELDAARHAVVDSVLRGDAEPGYTVHHVPPRPERDVKDTDSL